MKKIRLLAAFYCITFATFAQSNPGNTRQNGLGVDLMDLAFYKTLDLTYEHSLMPEVGLGVTARYCFDKGEELFNTEKYGITPFFRYYFLNKQDYGTKGFYVESFLKFFGGDTYTYESFFSEGEKKSYFDTAFGVGLGYKYVSNNGITLDLNIGGGRGFELSDYSPGFTGRACIALGFLF